MWAGMRNKRGLSDIVAAVGKDEEENYGRNGLRVSSRDCRNKDFGNNNVRFPPFLVLEETTERKFEPTNRMYLRKTL